MKAVSVIGSLFLIVQLSAQTPQFSWGMQYGQVNNLNRSGKLVENDSYGNVYCAGAFGGTIDLDPSGGSAVFNSTGVSDIYLAKYDEDRTLLWGFAILAAGQIACNDISVESNGDFVITGRFSGAADFDPGAGSFILTGNTFQNSYDAFVARYNASGQLLWAFQLGNTTYITCEGFSVDVDQYGCVYVTGMVYAGGVDFDPDSTGTNIIVPQSSSVFIAKYSTTGDHLFAFGYAGMGVTSQGFDLRIAGNGTLALAGIMNGTVNIDPRGTNTTHTGNGYFLAMYDTTGVLAWLTDIPYTTGGLTIDNTNGCVVVAGEFTDTVDVDPGPGVYDLTTNSMPQACVLRYTFSGNLINAFSFGGEDMEHCFGVDVDTTGNIYITGTFWDTIDVDPGPGVFTLLNGELLAGSNIYLARFSPTGNFHWAFSLGNVNAWESAFEISVYSNNVYATGDFTATMDIDPNPGVQWLTAFGSSSDAFVVKYIQDSAVGVMEALQSSVKLFPNPASQQFVVQLEQEGSYCCAITDVAGNVVMEASGNGSTFVVDCSFLAGGLYFLRISSEAGALEQKIVVAH